VFFITGRPSAIRSPTESNLRGVGYDQGWDGLDFKPSSVGTLTFKSGARAKLEQQGYDIVLNLGDQGIRPRRRPRRRAFKLPNPFYFIGD